MLVETEALNSAQEFSSTHSDILSSNDISVYNTLINWHQNEDYNPADKIISSEINTYFWPNLFETNKDNQITKLNEIHGYMNFGDEKLGITNALTIAYWFKIGNQTMNGAMLSKGGSWFVGGDAIEVFLSAQDQFLANNHRGGIDAFAQLVGGQHFIFRAVLQDDDGAAPARHVHLACRTDQ